MCLAVLGLITGTAVVFARKIIPEYDVETSTLFDLVSGFGVEMIALAWLAYMASLVKFLGYPTREDSMSASVISFVICLFPSLAILASLLHIYGTLHCFRM